MPDATSTWAVNPLALAQLINSSADNPYVVEKDWKDVEETLKAAFQVRDVRYLFEAEGGIPPRLQLFQNLANLREPLNYDQAVQHPLVKELMTRYKNPDVIPRLLPYLLPVADAVFTTPDDPAAIGVPVAGAYGNSMSTYVEDKVSYLDPVQGMALDCYFISALIALAWARPKEWVTRVQATIPDAPGALYQYRFYNELGEEDQISLRVDMLLPELMGRWVYAHSTDRKEAWVALFEKAYVIRRSAQNNKEPLPRDYRLITDHPTSPQKACQMLMGGDAYGRGPYAPMRPLEAVVGLCDTRGVTREPTMAWTWEPDWWKKVLTRKGLGFDRTGLMANHAYAVLGIIPPKVPDYVVLRNPWGRAPDCPDHKAGTWDPGAGENGEATVQLNQDGVFALKAEWFNDCFYQVGWVTP